MNERSRATEDYHWARTFHMEQMTGIEPASGAWEPYRAGPDPELRPVVVTADPRCPLLTPRCGARMAGLGVLGLDEP